MGLSRRVVRIELTTRTAGPDDRVALPGMTLWVVSWTVRQRLGRKHVRSAPHVTERGAHRMVANLLLELAPGIAAEDAFVDLRELMAVRNSSDSDGERAPGPELAKE